MKDRHIKTRNQMIAARSRNVARLFAGRIYVRADNVFLVNGNPDPEILFKCLCSINEIPDFHKEPTPRLLGFSASDIRPVGAKELNEWSQALQKWQKISQMMEATKRHTSENKMKLEKWAIEVDHLEKRKKLLYHLYSQIGSSENLVTKWIPSDSGEILVDKVFTEVAPGKVMPELWKWFAMINWWIGGKTSSMRFMYALSRVCPLKENYDLEQRIELIHKKLIQFQKDLEQKSKHTVFQIVIDLLESIPAEILNQIGIKPPRRARSIEEYLKRQVPFIEKKYNDIPRIDSENIIISLIITALDDSDIAFPSCLLIKPVKDGLAFIESILTISKNSQYGKFLGILDKIQTKRYSSADIRNVLNLVTAGADHEDINWLYQLELYNDTIQDFSDKKLSPRSLRLITSVIKEYGDSNYSHSEVEYVIDSLISAGSTWFVDIFAEWLLMIPKKYLDKSTIRGAWNTMLSGLALNKLDISNKSIIHQWANPQEQKYKMNLTSNLSSETKKCLRDLVHYQKLLGRGEIFPDSINNLLLAGQRKYLELTDLKKLSEVGKLSSDAKTRLLKLENEYRNGNDKITLNENKIKRKAQEITARFAIEALAKIIRDRYLIYFEFELKSAPPGWLKFHEFSDIIFWSKQLKDRQKEVFNELFNVWKDFGPDYKTHLPINRDWVNMISKRNNKIEKWLHPQVVKCQVLGNYLTIGLSNDPFRIFLMGTYFDTCLGLRSGFNRDSVLANAYDANKGVVFVFDEQGVVKARKLLAVSDGCGLVGYNTYINSNISEERKLIKGEITSYCANLAAVSHLKFVNSSKRIKSLTGIFWYDDGYEKWDIEKLNKINFQNHHLDMPPEEKIQVSRIILLVKQNKSWLTKIFANLKLLTSSELEKMVRSYPQNCEFLEEVLAYTARKTKNVQLIKELAECCQTGSGKFETQLADLVINGNEMPENSDFYRLESNNMRIDVVLSGGGTESAVPIIFARSLQKDYPGDKEILFHLLWKSLKVTNDLIPFLINERVWFASSDELFTIIHFLKLNTNGKLPNALIDRFLMHRHSSDIGGIWPRETFSMSQWLPVLKNPNDFLTLKYLLNEYNNNEYHEQFPDNKHETQIGIIIWAMRNKCPVTMNFLKELSKTVPPALLAFSLISERHRFRDYITSIALKCISSPASLMALLNVHGEDKTKEILQNARLLENPKIDALYDHVKLMFRAYQILSWKDFANKDLNLDDNVCTECLPFLIYQLHIELSQSIDGGFGKIKSIEEISGIKNSNFDTLGLIFFLTDRLRSAQDKDTQFGLRRFIHLFMNNQPYYQFPARIRLLLNLISNDKLYLNLEESFIDTTLHFDYDSYLISPFFFFFDSFGNRRVTADLQWEGDPEYLPTNLPDDLDEAYIYSSFLKSKNVKPKFLTELQKRLFDKAVT